MSKILDNYICSVIGNGVAMLLSFAPAIYYVWQGDFEKTMKIWDAKSLEIGATNCMAWLLYAASVYKRDGGVDLLLASAFGCGVYIVLLLFVIAHRKERDKVSCFNKHQ